MTLKEFREKLNRFAKSGKFDEAKETITDAWVAGRNDPEYPEGTVILQCITSNLKRYEAPGDSHTLSIFPERISRLN